jgi:transcriptional repressor NrdR
MVCIHCHSETQVINSRLQKKLNQVWRRRRCQHCAAIFTTLEIADFGAVWRVTDVNGSLAPFSRDKLFLSLLKSLEHRPKALTDASALADTITSKLQAPNNDGVIPVSQIIALAQVVLNRFDKLASGHYQAMHRR